MQIKIVEGDISAARAGAVIIGLCEGTELTGDAAIVDLALGGAVSQLLREGEIKGKIRELTLLHSLGKLPAERVLLAGLGKDSDLSVDKIRAVIAEACRFLRQKGIDDLATSLIGAGTNGIAPEQSAQALAEGAILGLYTFRTHITREEDEVKEVRSLSIMVPAETLERVKALVEQGRIVAEAANLARQMVNEPANFMTPSVMADKAVELGRQYGLEVTIFEREQMQQMGMGALLGVAQGSHQPPKFIVMSYRGKAEPGVDIALVGKGITFDSGGISLKPSEKMDEMKGDMAGGAAVMAALSAIAQLKPKVNVIALVPATENMPGGRALKPGDILTAMNGKTIEIISTDAEGRLILADALSYARKLEAKRIVDVATLTGACVVALGDICTGAFGSNQELMDRVLAAAKDTGELTWQLPMFEEYREQIKSNVADIKNSGGRNAGAITAAKFLAEFVDTTPWVHLDIAGTSDSEKEKGYIVKGGTGAPVRTLVELVSRLDSEFLPTIHS